MAVQYGLLIDYQYCTGCQTCEVACKEEHDFPVGKWGIRVLDDGPWQKDDADDQGKSYNWNRIPVPTDLCDLCEDRVKAGKAPTCVHHCQAEVMVFGTIEELTKELLKKPRQVLWAPKD
jgi:anaerobic dimethyl sulfoxide reductase subunit B (iron-sulfur subunit)